MSEFVELSLVNYKTILSWHDRLLADGKIKATETDKKTHQKLLVMMQQRKEDDEEFKKV